MGETDEKGVVGLDILGWLTQTGGGEVIFTALVSMLPVVELRGGLPFGVSMGLPLIVSFFASVVGNMIPVSFIVVYIRRIFDWMRKRMPRFNRLVDKMEEKAHLKGEKVMKYRFWGILILVAIPLPGTGAWTGALVAALLNMRLREALPAILAGVLIAGVAISILTYGVTSLIAV